MSNPNHSPDLPRCGAKTRAGGTCVNLPMTGGKRCRVHGGSSPQAKAKARTRIAEGKARAVMVRLGLPEPVEISAAEAMIWMVSAKYAEVLWLRAMVGSIDPGDLVWGVSRERTDAGTAVNVAGAPVPQEKTFEARPNIWWQMLRTGEDQLVRYAAAARAAGCDEARVRLAESQGDAIVGALRRIFVRLALSEAQQVLVGTVVPEELRALVTARAGGVEAS